MNDEKEINPKFEYRNSKQIQMTKIQMIKTKSAAFGGNVINSNGLKRKRGNHKLQTIFKAMNKKQTKNFCVFRVFCGPVFNN
jgi:hypothetical protein